MADAPSDKSEKNESLDVVVLGAPTDDGKGTRVLRVKDDSIGVGEVRPMREGEPIHGEVVKLEPRPGAPAVVRNVKTVLAAPASTDHKGPARVTTDAYRDRWELVFGEKTNDELTLN